MPDRFEIRRVRRVKQKYERTLLLKKNVVGVGVGYRMREDRQAEEAVLTVMVRQKEPDCALEPADQIPDELDGVPVEVQEVGTFKAQ